MSAALLPRIFDLFVQGEPTRDRAKGGLGIGLTLVKRLVEMHGGTVSASSEGPGCGSVFTVRLPRLALPVKPVAAEPTRTVSRGARRVLIVEDSDDLRRMLRFRLELDGHEVHETGDGTTGLAEALRLHPDVAVIDIGLPGMDGWEVARQLRAAKAGRRMVLVAISGYGQLTDQQSSREAGFDAHLVKPLDLDTLTDVIHGGARCTTPANAGAVRRQSSDRR